MRYARLSAQVNGAGYPCRVQGACAPRCSRSRNWPLPEAPLPHHDMVEAFASDRADQPFNMTVLPRRAWRDGPLANAHGSQPPGDCGAIEGVAVTDEVARYVQFIGRRLR